MRIDLYATEAQYLEHLVPIWFALPLEHQGRVTIPRQLLGLAQSHGVPSAAIAIGRAGRSGGPIMVASHQDFRQCLPRLVVYVEHGAGQSYLGDPASAGHRSFSGGGERDAVSLFVVPNEATAEKNRQRYPEIPNAVVGDSPKLDAWRYNREFPKSDETRVVVSFHPDLMPLARTVPECRSAFSHYEGVLSDLAADDRWSLFGHAHPRFMRLLGRRYRVLGIPVIESFDEVVATADVYVADNTSTLYEFASVGKPVVVLNAPWYRRDVEHGLRFWEHSRVGVNCDSVDTLIGAVGMALRDPEAIRKEREAVVGAVYPLRTGRSAVRAAEAVLEHVAEVPEPEEGRVMGNPYAPKSSRRRSQEEPVLFPERRLERLGATPDEVRAWKHDWEQLPADERRESAEAFALLTDDEVRADLEASRDEVSEEQVGEATGEVREAVEVAEGQTGELSADEIEKVGEIATSDVPDGSIAVVMEWVGDDEARAAAALFVEERGQGRKGLVKQLSRLIGD